MKSIILTTIASLAVMHAQAQWSANTITNLEVAGLQSSDIQTATTSTGGTWIAFYNNNGGNYDMRVQLLNAQGVKQFGPDGLLVSNQTSGSATYVFNVTIDASDNLIIAFQDQRFGTNGAVLYKVTTGGTLPWGADGIYLGPGLAPSACVLSTNEIIAAWNNNTNGISFQKISTSGTTVWASPLAVNVPTPGRAISRVQAVSLTNGTFGLVFQQRTSTTGNPISTNLYEQRYANNGDPIWLAGATQLSDNITANSRYYSVIAAGDTTFVGYFANPFLQNRFDAYLQRVNSDGSLPWGINGSDFSVDPNNYEMEISIARDVANAVTWAVCTYSNPNQTQYGIYTQKFSTATGARLLTDNAKEVYAISNNTQQHHGSLALCGSDPMFMFTDVTNKLYVSRLNTNGGFAWAANEVELCGTTNSKLRYNFSAAVNGQAVAVWQENRGTEDRAYAQNASCTNIFTGINNVTEATISVYPNPVKDKLHIILPSSSLNTIHAKLYDMHGRLLLSKRINNNDEIDTRSLNAGMYILRLVSSPGKMIQVQKILKL